MNRPTIRRRCFLQTDHFQRVDTALRWVTEQGYKPVFYHEGFLGAPQ